jgi:hypothetical protein
MNGLSLEMFLAPDLDLEINQYKILNGLKEYRQLFNKKKVYPALDELINVHISLEQLLRQKNQMTGSFPKKIQEYDLKNKEIKYEIIEKIKPNIELFFSLVNWALPKIKEAIDEGIILYEFVEKEYKIDEIGILPLYKEEGYFFVPDVSSTLLQVYRFESSIFNSHREKMRSLKTRFIKSVELEGGLRSPEILKLDLINQFKDLPNPATFLCSSELDFPFQETMFPVAKRKLMGHLKVLKDKVTV